MITVVDSIGVGVKNVTTWLSIQRNRLATESYAEPELIYVCNNSRRQ